VSDKVGDAILAGMKAYFNHYYSQVPEQLQYSEAAMTAYAAQNGFRRSNGNGDVNPFR